MLHAEFQDHQTSGSEQDFFYVLPYMGSVPILVN